MRERERIDDGDDDHEERKRERERDKREEDKERESRTMTRTTMTRTTMTTTTTTKRERSEGKNQSSIINHPSCRLHWRRIFPNGETTRTTPASAQAPGVATWPWAGYGMGGFSDKGEIHQEVLRCHGADREERRACTDSQKTREAVHAQINAHLDRSDVLLQHIFVIERERERIDDDDDNHEERKRERER